MHDDDSHRDKLNEALAIEQTYWLAVEKYSLAQHTVFSDDHPVNVKLDAGLERRFDQIILLSTSPIERTEVPFEPSDYPRRW